MMRKHMTTILGALMVLVSAACETRIWQGKTRNRTE